jgi:hypothetical protein
MGLGHSTCQNVYNSVALTEHNFQYMMVKKPQMGFNYPMIIFNHYETGYNFLQKNSFKILTKLQIQILQPSVRLPHSSEVKGK